MQQYKGAHREPVDVLILRRHTSAPRTFRSSATFLSASRTNIPLYAPASFVNFTSSSMGQKTGIFLFSAMRISSSPFAGDKCTMPLPLSISTNSSDTATWYPFSDANSPSFGIISKSGCSYCMPSKNSPFTVLTISYCSIFAAFNTSSNIFSPIIHVSSPTLRNLYSPSGLNPIMASVTMVNGIVVHTMAYAPLSLNLTL